MPPGRRSFAPWVLALALVCGAAAAGGALAEAPAPPAPGEAALAAGAPLTGALLELRGRGLALVFSSLVVLPEMRVVATPRATAPRAMLDELLAPHGLAVREEPGGTLLIVAGGAAAPRTLRGTVRSRRALEPVAGAGVTVLETGLETLTDSAGRFTIDGLPPGAYTLETRRPGFVVERRERVGVLPVGELEIDVLLQPAPLTSDEITVHPSRVSLLDDSPSAPLGLSRAEILALPHLGGDVFRALTLQPGTAGNDVSAQLHVRGGRRDEVLVRLDGQELYEAYHLKDFDSALSVVATSTLASLDLTTGAFPAAYGDRMGGVLDIATVAPAHPRRFRIAVGVLDAQIEGSGASPGGTAWLASLRRGTTDFATGLFGKEENPSYWDVFAKVDRRLTERQSLRGSLLAAGDRLHFEESPGGELRRFDTEYGTQYVWLTHQVVVNDRLYVDTAVSSSGIDRHRRGEEDEEEKRFAVEDERDLDVTGVLQSWNFQATAAHFVELGAELRRYEADYDYRSFREFDTPLAALRAEPREGRFDARGTLEDDHTGFYLTDRFRALSRLTLELGVRHDRHDLDGESVWSPRADLAWNVGGETVVRLGWGRFHQSQRVYEAMIEDGDARIYPVERAEHRVAGVERRFASGSPVSAVRLEAYERRVATPRPRYESLFEPLEPFSEGEVDRYRFVPERSVAEGVELYLRGRAGERTGWWLNYGWAKSEDRIAGAWIPRQIDQRHTLNLDLHRRLGRNWEVNVAWRYHSGRPTTAVFLDVLEPEPPDPEEEEPEPTEPELVPRLGPLNGERLRPYHRLDLRVGRSWTLPHGRLTFFADVQNLYHRENVAGFDVEVDEEAGAIVRVEEHWPGFFASGGLAWEF